MGIDKRSKSQSLLRQNQRQKQFMGDGGQVYMGRGWKYFFGWGEEIQQEHSFMNVS